MGTHGAQPGNEARKAATAKARAFVEKVVAAAIDDGLLGREQASAFATDVEESAVLDGVPLTEEACDEMAHDLEDPDPMPEPTPKARREAEPGGSAHPAAPTASAPTLRPDATPKPAGGG